MILGTKKQTYKMVILETIMNVERVIKGL